MQEDKNISHTIEPDDSATSCEQTDMNTLTTSKAESAQPKSAPKRVFIFLLIGLVILGLYIFLTTPITESQKDKRIAQAYLEDGYDAAMELVRRYYGDSDNAIAWAMFFSDQEDSNIKDLIEITDHNLSVTSSGDYFDYAATIKNNSDKTLSYIEINIYLLDSEKNIIYSDWTNWSGTLPPGASTIVDTMFDYIDGVHYYRASVEEVSTK